MPWDYLSLSRLGAIHAAAGEVCQDFSAVRVLGSRMLIAVADGAGSAPNAAEGARLAVTFACSAWERAVNSSPKPRTRVRRSVRAARHCLEQLAWARAQPIASYATTLLLAEASPEGVATAQIGDGAIVFQSRNTFGLIGAPQHGPASNTTRFITDDQWRKYLQLHHHQPRPDALAVFTDGLEYQILTDDDQPVEGFFRPAFEALNAPSSAAWFQEQLASEELSQLTGDDITLVLAIWKECSSHDSDSMAVMPTSLSI